VFKVVRPSRKWQHVDLKTVRETLVYMENDCKACPGLERVATALEHTISEIDRVATNAQPEPALPVVAAHFIPAGL
jgi:hypothetical protein